MNQPFEGKITRWGIGPRFTLWSSLYFSVTLIPSVYFRDLFRIKCVSCGLLRLSGVVMIVLGLCMYLSAIITVMRAYKREQLVKDGIYGFCRHPVYASWLLFIVPGILLLIGSWIMFLCPVLMYITIRTMIKEEEKKLTEIFGSEYIDYAGSVPGIIPLGFLKRPKHAEAAGE